MATVNTCEIIEKLCEPLVLSHTDARQSKRKYTHSKSSSSSSTTSSESSSSSSDSAISEGKQWELFEEKLRKNSFGIHAKDRDFELDMHDRRDLLTCTHELVVHHLDEEDKSGWDDDGVHTVVHSRYSMADLTAAQKSKSFPAPDELRALLNPAGEPNLTEVITREQIKLYGTVADTIIDCMPPASQFGVYGRVQEDGNPTYALLVLHAKTLLPLGGARESRFLESSGHFPLWRSIVMFSNVFQSDTSPWEAKNCASILPPAVASSFMKMRQGGHQHLAGVAGMRRSSTALALRCTTSCMTPIKRVTRRQSSEHGKQMQNTGWGRYPASPGGDTTTKTSKESRKYPSQTGGVYTTLLTKYKFR